MEDPWKRAALCRCARCKKEMSFLAYLTCVYCSSSIIVRVMTMPHGLIGNAILTDLTSSEVMDFSLESEIEANNVLSLHELMSKDSSFIDKLRKY